MTRTNILAAAIGAAFILPAGANAFVTYDASLGTLPHDQGWEYYENTNTQAPPPSISGGVLRLGPTTAGVQGYRRSDYAIDFDIGVDLMANLRIVNSTVWEAGTTRRAGYYLFIGDHLGRIVTVGIGSDRIFLGSDNTHANGGIMPVDTTAAFNDYSLTVRSDGAHLSMNGNHLLSVALGPTNLSLANTVWFGDLSGVAFSESEMTYLSYAPVPEPATMAALGIGALLVARRRRKKA
jgi:hypothetical protein